jgi:hypothetical protein
MTTNRVEPVSLRSRRASPAVNTTDYELFQGRVRRFSSLSTSKSFAVSSTTRVSCRLLVRLFRLLVVFVVNVRMRSLRFSNDA